MIRKMHSQGGLAFAGITLFMLSVLDDFPALAFVTEGPPGSSGESKSIEL
jgi:hypothetical protein